MKADCICNFGKADFFSVHPIMVAVKSWGVWGVQMAPHASVPNENDRNRVRRMFLFC